MRLDVDHLVKIEQIIKIVDRAEFMAGRERWVTPGRAPKAQVVSDVRRDLL